LGLFLILKGENFMTEKKLGIDALKSELALLGAGR